MRMIHGGEEVNFSLTDCRLRISVCVFGKGRSDVYVRFQCCTRITDARESGARTNVASPSQLLERARRVPN